MQYLQLSLFSFFKGQLSIFVLYLIDNIIEQHELKLM
ncbi:hypothetical protein J2Z48_002964 [Croceifilum oryzae]|uniref:Uncharacterized protein n=1 Tax=Croceifilum oryzae TaxID=1553429 RepID=A0AAJ1TH16_9BACL|nr:hypothetical protein [Croceifilum oryzae]